MTHCSLRYPFAGVALAALFSIAAAVTITKQEFTIGAGPYEYDFVLLADCHVGEGSKSTEDMEDFGSEGYDDVDCDSLETSPALEGVTACRDYINSQLVGKSGYDLRFVLVTGDITSSAERSEWQRARRVFASVDHSLSVIPIMGNHDGWPYVGRGLSVYPPAPGYFSEQPEDEVVVGEYFVDVFKGWYDTLRFVRPMPAWEQCRWMFEPTDETGHPWPSYYNDFAFSYQGCRFIATDFNTRKNPPPSERPGLRGEPDTYVNADRHWTMDWLTAQVAVTRPGERIICAGHHAYFAAYSNFQADELHAIATAGLRNNRPVATSVGGHIHPFGDKYGRLLDGKDTVCDYYAPNAAKDGYVYVFHIRDSVRLAVSHPESAFTAGDSVPLASEYGYEGDDNAPSEFVWEFGDGSTDTGAAAKHVFPALAPDTVYKVTLVVTTSSGRRVWASDTVRVVTPWVRRQPRERSPSAAEISVGPNPLAADFATVCYALPRPQPTTLTVFDLAGRVARQERLALAERGTLRLDLSGLKPGVYVAELKARGFTVRDKMVVVARGRES